MRLPEPVDLHHDKAGLPPLLPRKREAPRIDHRDPLLRQRLLDDRPVGVPEHRDVAAPLEGRLLHAVRPPVDPVLMPVGHEDTVGPEGHDRVSGQVSTVVVVAPDKCAGDARHHLDLPLVLLHVAAVDQMVDLSDLAEDLL